MLLLLFKVALYSKICLVFMFNNLVSMKPAAGNEAVFFAFSRRTMFLVHRKSDQHTNLHSNTLIYALVTRPSAFFDIVWGRGSSVG